MKFSRIALPDPKLPKIDACAEVVIVDIAPTNITAIIGAIRIDLFMPSHSRLVTSCRMVCR